MVSKHIKWPG